MTATQQTRIVTVQVDSFGRCPELDAGPRLGSYGDLLRVGQQVKVLVEPQWVYLPGTIAEVGTRIIQHRDPANGSYVQVKVRLA